MMQAKQEGRDRIMGLAMGAESNFVYRGAGNQIPLCHLLRSVCNEWLLNFLSVLTS